MARLKLASQRICRLCYVKTPDGRTCEACKIVRERISEILDNRRHEDCAPPPWIETRIDYYAARAKARLPLFSGVIP